MGRACCVLGCSSGGDAPSHQIPKNPELFKKWKSMIYSEKIQHLTDEQISKCAVCYRHFADDDYLLTYRVRKLKRGVAPSLNLPNGPVKKNMMTKSDRTHKITNISTKAALTVPVEETTIKKETTIKEEDTFVVKLFEDLPETLESYLHKNSQEPSVPEKISEQQFDMHKDHVNLTDEECETDFNIRILKRIRMRLTEEQSILLQRKKQAEKYAKTPTIQKLLSVITNTERLSLQSRIRRSKYSPKMYIKLYHDIAKRKAFGQL